MARLVKIAVYPADLGGCGMYRITWPAEALKAQGADIDIVLPTESPDRQVNAWWWTNDEGESTLVDVKAPDADVIVIQRPLSDTLAKAIPMLQAKGVRVVVEIDDDFEAISPRNISWRDVHPGRNPRRNWVHLRNACAIADLVVVSTPALAKRYGGHGRVAVVPNFIPARYLAHWPDPHEGVIVGWSGSLDTHPDDLQVTGGGVARAVRSTGATFAVVGTGKGVQKALGLGAPPLACGWRPIAQYPEAVAQLDVGIVPLELSRFNEAKSWLKGLEMAALGVPFVASPTAPYRELAEFGVGALAERPKHWEYHVRALVQCADLRAERAGAGREVARRLTIEGNCGRFYEAWSSVVNRLTPSPSACL